jgi:hypothetical protein
MPIEEVFEQWRKRSNSNKLALHDLRLFVRGGECPSLEWLVYSNGEVAHLVRSAEQSAEFWRGFADLSVTTKVTGIDVLVVTSHAYRHPAEDARVSFFLRIADVERESKRLYPTPAAPPPAAHAALDRQLEDKKAATDFKAPIGENKPTPRTEPIGKAAEALANKPASKSKSAEDAHDGRKGPGRPSPKPLVADEIDRLKKEDANILKEAMLYRGKMGKLWEHLARVCKDKGYDIKPKSIGRLIRRNEMLPTQKRQIRR